MDVRIVETAPELALVETIQRKIWPGDDVEIVPVHLLVTAAHNGGIILGAFEDDEMIGFAFGFPGLGNFDGEVVLKHCSHMLGVLPNHRDQGVGFRLKRAQWQLVRHQKIPLITWTYDPLQSRNALFNIAKLGAVCNIYLEDLYGDMRDALNAGIPSDRFQVELWVNSTRVLSRLDRRPRSRLNLSHFLQAGAEILNPARKSRTRFVHPEETELSLGRLASLEDLPPLLLVEIPSEIQSIKAGSPELAFEWRSHTRAIFSALFGMGYLVTDFLFAATPDPSSFYVLSYGEASLGRHEG